MVTFGFREVATPKAGTPSALLRQWQQFGRRPIMFGRNCACCGPHASISLDEVGESIFEYLKSVFEANGDAEINAFLKCIRGTAVQQDSLTALLVCLAADSPEPMVPANIEKLCLLLQRSIDSVSNTDKRRYR